jgi:zinc protease
LRFIFFLFLTTFFLSKNSDAIQFESLETKNGIKFWLIEDKALPLVSISFSFKGGSILDPVGKSGVTNLMTSLLDEGTQNFTASEYRLFKRENGIKISFSTSKERIEGTFQVVKPRLQEGFYLLHESINKAKFPINEIKKVKSQVEASIKIDNSNISTIASNKFNKFFFKDKLIGRNTKGSLETLGNISRDDIQSIYRSSFIKNRLVIGISGDIEPNLAKKYVDYVFGDLPSKKFINPISMLENLNKGMEIIEMKTPQTTVVFGQKGLGRKDKEYFAARVINYVLGGGGFQSRLYKEIREANGLVYSIYSYLLPYEYAGVIVGGFQTRNQNVGKTIEKVKTEWNRIKTEGITKIELQNAKTYYKGSFSRNFTSTLSIASLLMIVQYYDLGEDYFDKRDLIIDNLKLNELNNLAKNLFDSETLFFMIVGEPKI